MKTLRLKDGDLAVSSRAYSTVTGTSKISQDLRCALGEPLGIDRFHTNWGSTLEQSVGVVVDETARAEIETEVGRVVQNYSAVQQDKIQTDVLSGVSRFSTSDVLNRIEQIAVTAEIDTITVGITLRAASGEVIVMNEALA